LEGTCHMTRVPVTPWRVPVTPSSIGGYLSQQGRDAVRGRGRDSQIRGQRRDSQILGCDLQIMRRVSNISRGGSHHSAAITGSTEEFSTAFSVSAEVRSAVFSSSRAAREGQRRQTVI